MDESGHEQLAVTAEERETRDGHYTYKAEGPLAQIRPLSASNMAMVTEWLDQARCSLVSSPIPVIAQLYCPPPALHRSSTILWSLPKTSANALCCAVDGV